MLKRGDIVFGEAGFQKGRSIVLVDAFENSTTNAHGICARREDGGLVESMFFRCIFNWYRNLGLVDLAAVGGSGGHLSPSYFDDFIHIPIFPDDKKEAITKLYHNAAAPPDVPPTMDTFVEWHRKWNESLGIWELDKEMKRLQDTLVEIQEQIINGEIVKVPLT